MCELRYNTLMRKKESFTLHKPLTHVAFIMDGNGRWANARGLPRHLGHKEACKRLREVVDTCREFDIKVLSFYAFSTENWNRPQDEIDHLMDYLEEFFHSEMDYLMSIGTHVIISGDYSKLRPSTKQVCDEVIADTAKNDTFVLNICLNYGGRDDIVRAAKAMAEEYKEGKIGLDDFTEANFSKHLYTMGLPDIDLMIRTSGEQRLSNYLLYQNAYAEFVFTPVKWPDFRRKQVIDCLKEYDGRNRRYGGLKNE